MGLLRPRVGAGDLFAYSHCLACPPTLATREGAESGSRSGEDVGTSVLRNASSQLCADRCARACSVARPCLCVDVCRESISRLCWGLSGRHSNSMPCVCSHRSWSVS